jgi:hypothetical protein
MTWNNPFVWFLIFVFVVWGAVFIFMRPVLATLSKQAAEHAKLYAAAYVKGSALVAIAVLTSFGETFKALSPDVAAILPWWSWLDLFFKPIVAGLAVYVAFVDGTMKKIRDERAGEDPKPK